MKSYLIMFALIHLAYCQDGLEEDVSTTVADGNLTNSLQSSTALPEEENPYDAYLNSASTSACGELMRKSDECAKIAMFISPDVRVPQTEEQVDFHCGELKKTIRCISAYKSCLKAFPKQLYGLLVHYVKKKMVDICTVKNKPQTLGHLKCFAGENEAYLNGVINGFTTILVNISGPGEDPQTVIPKCCCSYHIFKSEATTAVNKECQPRTGLKTGEFVSDLVTSIASPLIELACGSYNSMDSCKKLMPRETEWYTEWVHTGKDKNYKYSPILPLIKVLNNLDSKVNLRRK